MKKIITVVLLAAALITIFAVRSSVFATATDTVYPPKGVYFYPTDSALADNDLTVSVSVVYSSEPTVELYYTSGSAAEVKVTAVRDTNSAEMYTLGTEKLKYAVYSATIPASAVRFNTSLSYYFSVDGIRTKTASPSVISSLPATLVITEIFTNPKTLASNTYIEVTNISDAAVDLYGYRFTYSSSPDLPVSKTVYLCENKGVNLLAPGKSAVIWFVSDFTYKGSASPSVGYFTAKCRSDGIIRAPELVIPVDTTVVTASGVRKVSGEFFTLGSSSSAVINLVKNSNGSDKPECIAYVNTEPSNTAEMGNAVFYKSKPDSTGVLSVIKTDTPTPGYTEGMPLPSSRDKAYPAVAYAPTMTDTRLFNVFIYETDTVYDAVMCYKTDVMTDYAEAPLQRVSARQYTATVPNEILALSRNIEYYFKVSDVTSTVICKNDNGSAFTAVLEDHVAPCVSFMSPEPYYTFLDTKKPSFTGTVFDMNKITSHMVLVDNKIMTEGVYLGSDNSFSYRSQTELSYGLHTITVKLTDEAGNTSEHTQLFYIANGEVMNYYRGEVHAHTTRSDGIGTLEDAYTYARDVGGVDFFAVTDHSNMLGTQARYDDSVAISDSFNEPGKFVALYGYEQTWGTTTKWWGHMNALNISTMARNDTYDLPSFFRLLAENPSSVGMFNHPGYVWGNFEEYNYYSTAADKNVCLSEIKGSGYDWEYMLSLNRGWHVSPVHNEDNHSGKWTTVNEATGYVLAPSLTRQNITEAMRLNRTYTTTDGTLKIHYQINGEWLGSRLDSPEKLNVDISVSTEKSQGIGLIQLVTEDNVVVNSFNAGSAKSCTWKYSIDPNYDYYYVRVINGSNYAVTAPIWVEGRSTVSVSSMNSALIKNPAQTNYSYKITSEIKNISSSALTDVKVSFYSCNSAMSYTSVLDLKTATPIGTYAVGELAPYANATLEIAVPSSSATRRIYAIVRGYSEGKSYGDISCLTLSPIYITEIAPKTAAYNSVSNPFDYLEIYNNTNSKMSLNGYILRILQGAGASVSKGNATTVALSGKTIEAQSSIILWFQPVGGNGLTVADFNKFYKTNLVDGDTIYIIKSGVLLDTAQRLDIYYSSTSNVITRADYNADTNYGKDLVAGRSITYRYDNDITLTSRKISSASIVSPGVVSANQVPAVVAQEDIVPIRSGYLGVNSIEAATAAGITPVRESFGIFKVIVDEPQTPPTDGIGFSVLIMLLLGSGGALTVLIVETVSFFRRRVR